MKTTRVFTPKTGRDAVHIEIDGKILVLRRANLDNFASNALKEAELERQFGDLLPESIWIHQNRDGNMAVATGKKPAVWPEDEVDLWR